jgi:hypothetical protein
MTHSDNPPENSSRRALFAVALSVGCFAIIAFALITGGGCSKPPKPITEVKNTTVQEEPWDKARNRLKKDTDWGTCKTTLTGLTADLNSKDQNLPVLSDAAFLELKKLIPLAPGDADEIRATTFTTHDSVYLYECLAFRDAVRSLSLEQLPPARRAELAFAWVCRQVYLRPWLRQINGPDATTVVSPTAVLRRGFGSGLERMYVLLAVLQQLELDGCLIGGPDAASASPGFPVVKPDQTLATGAPRGPFWAVGVRIDNDVKLFDPWRGIAFPVTLSQLKANPDAAKAWFEDKANLSGATLEDAKKATVYLALPVNALSPRMAILEQNIKADLGVKLAYDATAYRNAFPDPKPAYWNPPEDPDMPAALAYSRASRVLLPLDLGGMDRGGPGARLYDEFRRAQIPPSVFFIKGVREGPIATRIRGVSAQILAMAFIEPPNPRERIQRGQFQDAARDLVQKRDAFASGLERLRVNKDAEQQIAEWLDRSEELFSDLGNAELERRDAAAGKGNVALADAKVASANAAIDAHWKQPAAQFMLDRVASEVGLAEATMLLALAKHEVAERSQIRADTATGADAERLKADAILAWKNARSAWRSYETLATAHAGFPGRAEHANALAQRAEQLASDPAKK